MHPMKKRICAHWTGVLLIVLVSTLRITAASTYGDFSYEINDGEVTITGFSGTSVEALIPSTIEGFPVTAIGSNAFERIDGLFDVTIPNSVISIGEKAFYQCGELGEIVIPDSVEEMGIGAFSSCNQLRTITLSSGVTQIPEEAFYGSDIVSLIIPEGVTEIGPGAFASCGRLSQIQFPSSLEKIGPGAFGNCTDMSNIVLPEGLVEIEDSAFSSCRYMESISFPSTLTALGENVFRSCARLDWVSVADANTVFSSLEGVLFNKDRTELILYPEYRIGEYVIPDGVVHIADYAFSGADKLSHVTFPDSLRTIGARAFYDCEDLTGVIVFNPGLLEIGADAFNECADFEVPVLPESLNRIGDGAFEDSPYDSPLVIPASLTSLGAKFYRGQLIVDENNPNYKSVDGILFSKDMSHLLHYPTARWGEYAVPDGVTMIGKRAFFGTDPDMIYLPDGLLRIEDEALYGAWINAIPDSVDHIGYRACVSLSMPSTTLVLPSALTFLGEEAFHNANFEFITIQSGITEIKARTFRSCGNLSSINLPVGITGIGEEAFFKCTNLANISMPDSLQTIGSRAFSGCKSLVDKLLLPHGLKTIKEDAFRNSALGVLTIPGTVTEIGLYAFRDAGITSLVINEGIAEIADRVFSYNEISSITFPDSLEKIGYAAFDLNYELAELNLPPNLKTIDHYAFYGCSIANLSIPDSVLNLGNSAFGKNDMTVVSIPASVVEIGDNPFSGCENLLSINVDAANPNFYSNEGVLFSKDGTQLISYPAAISGAYAVPAGVTEIASAAFKDCTLLTEITLPNSLQSIESGAFQSAISLATITIPDSVQHLGSWAFASCQGLASVGLSNNLTALLDEAFYQCINLEHITIPDSVTYHGTSVFRNCLKLSSITLPDGIHYIGAYCFRNCRELIEINLPANLLAIENYTFKDCYLLETVTLGDQIRWVGNSAFETCRELKEFFIPSSVTFLGGNIIRYSGGARAYLLGDPPDYDIDPFRINQDIYYSIGANGWEESYSGVMAIPFKPGFWFTATVEEGDWLSYPWFGWFWDFSNDWIYHLDDAWWMIGTGNPEEFYYYDIHDACWSWTSSSIYPFAYQFSPYNEWVEL